MKKVISTETKPIKLWLDDIEDGALEQAKNLANLPFVFKHIAIMPDSHQGYGMPIGAVMATIDVVVPNAVGVDIGCGMCAVKTSLTEISTDKLKGILSKVRKIIPVGFNSHKSPQFSTVFPTGNYHKPVREHLGQCHYQLGTLGGGNHFIEIQKGSDGHIWLMIHSGSRNLGFKVAKYYNDLADELNTKWFSSVHAEHQLAFFPSSTILGLNYIEDMQFCVDYAFANRAMMVERILGVIAEVVGDVTFGEVINVSHNHAVMEHHFGKNVMVHRKGATKACKDQLGIIPGSQGTSSYIVKGKGNPESFMSCSHGAGRKMGRKQAQRELDITAEVKALAEAGVIHSIRSVKDLDEAPGAYKNIFVVMDNQKDLVDIVVELKPLAVIKG